MTFETALTGLKAASSDLDVTGNNIANSQTTGFKSSRAEFADIFATSNLGLPKNAIGQGVRLANVSQQFTQGQFNFTGNSLDLAINGQGFFQVSDDGEKQYTRNGAFNLDRDGYIIDANGRRLTGFKANDEGAITGEQDELQVNIGNVSPAASSKLSLSANLDASAQPPATTPFAPTDPDSYNFSTSTTLYDSQGGEHLATYFFVKSGGNQWDVQLSVEAGGGNPPVTQSVAALTFAPDGSLDSGNSTITNPVNVALGPNVDPLTLAPEFGELTQFGSPFEVKQLRQDGFPAGQFSGLGVESDGRIMARFTNGKTEALGQVALARFPSPANLQQRGDTSWVETFQSGVPVMAPPGDSGTGSIEPGALEQSNVDLTEQLVQMITAQRNYQANSQMISTQNDVTQEILNIR